MGSGDLSTDLSMGVLTPTPSVRPAEGRSPHPDAEGTVRRHSRPKPEDADEEATSDASEPAHQLDRLA
jgi:hypothetical protein